MFCNVIDLVRAEFDMYELTDLIWKDAFYETINAVVRSYDKRSAGDKDRK